jgi:hypothetical protein
MDAVFYGNVFDNLIIGYLDMKDIYNISLVNRQFEKIIDGAYIMKTIKSRIEGKLSLIFGKHYDAFVRMMVKYKAILSGSFILQCILNEKWNNSDIDVYVDQKYESSFHKDFRRIATYWDEDYDFMYTRAFGHITNVSNFYIINPNEQIFSKGAIEGVTGTSYAKTTKIQIVTINTSKDYSLIDHTYNTGFNVCKNRLIYNSKGKMQLYLKNYREAIMKTTTFTIENVDDFFYRIEKYSKRGFYFRPKYNRLLCLEYLFLRFRNIHVLKTNFDEKKYNQLGKECGSNCVVKLFYRNVRHYHDSAYTSHMNANDIRYTIVENKDGAFNRVLPLLMSAQSDKRSELYNALFCCQSIDEYAKIRNKFTNIPINVYNINTDDYDMQYGLSTDFDNQLAMHKTKGNLMQPNTPQTNPRNRPQNIQQNRPLSKNAKSVRKKKPQKIDWLISSLNK